MAGDKEEYLGKRSIVDTYVRRQAMAVGLSLLARRGYGSKNGHVLGDVTLLQMVLFTMLLRDNASLQRRSETDSRRAGNRQ